MTGELDKTVAVRGSSACLPMQMHRLFELGVTN